MTAVVLPKTSIQTGFLVGESGWADEMNRNLRLLDALVNLAVVDKDLTTPPSASGGDVYIVGGGATGAWAGHDGQLAIWQQGDDLTAAWYFVTPKESWRAWLVDEAVFYQYVASAWVKDETSEVTPQRYSTTIGDGSAANFFVSHNLNTRNVHVTVYRTASPWDDIIIDVSRPSANMIEISGFVSAPAAGEYTVFVSR